jgi:hypothetical protein
MGLSVDHVFVCCDVGAPEARALIDLGWPEGAPNTHPGQGTANRRFFFRNAYLELLWVTEAEEARSEMVGRTRLWERWSRRRSGACRFGVVLRREGANESDLPFRSWSYRPTYLPAGWAIEVARDLRLDEPELFYLDVPSSQPGALGSTHARSAERLLTNISISGPSAAPASAAIEAVASLGLLSLRAAPDHVIQLTFDGGRASKSEDLRPRLLLIVYW